MHFILHFLCFTVASQVRLSSLSPSQRPCVRAFSAFLFTQLFVFLVLKDSVFVLTFVKAATAGVRTCVCVSVCVHVWLRALYCTCVCVCAAAINNTRGCICYFCAHFLPLSLSLAALYLCLCVCVALGASSANASLSLPLLLLGGRRWRFLLFIVIFYKH